MLSLLPSIYQWFASQPHPFYYIAYIVAIVTNYSNLTYQCFTNHYQFNPLSLPVIALLIFSSLTANVLPVINLPLAMGNLPIAANGLPIVPE